jgi:multidrug efflux pump subunit AcrA (membrane-fusion protein)
VKMSDEVREVLEGTLHVAEANLADARAELELRVAQANAADRVYLAAQQTHDALKAALEIEPVEDDKFKTYGED